MKNFKINSHSIYKESIYIEYEFNSKRRSICFDKTETFEQKLEKFNTNLILDNFKLNNLELLGLLKFLKTL